MVNSTTTILSVLTLIFLVATMYVFTHGSCPDSLRTIVSSSFTGFSSALLLALRASSNTLESVPLKVVPNNDDLSNTTLK